MTHALLNAAEIGDVARIHSLIASGHDVNGRIGTMTTLHRAACYGRLATVVALIGAGAEIDARDVYGWTPLHHAALNGRWRVVPVLIAAGADLRAETDDSVTIWHMAHLQNMGSATRRVLKLLLRAGASFDDSYSNLLSGTTAGAIVESVKAAGGWDEFVLKHRAVLKSIVSKCAPVPDDCLLAIAAFVAPPGGW